MSAFTGTNDEMYVTKRSGEREIVAFDKILQRIKKLGQEAGIKINYTTLVMKVIDQLYDGISTTKIDELSAEQCASMASTHPDYNVLAGRIVVSNHHKNTAATFSEAMDQLWNYLDKHDKHSPLVSQNLYDVVQAHRDELNAMCDYERDYLIDYFGFKTLDRAYMMKVNRVTVERPQHMWLRVAIGIHGDNMVRIRETYDLMSQKFFTHATPTLFNAGTPHPQLSSCFLIAMESDSIEGIYNTLKDCALISKWAGGIGMHIHNIRASGSHIRGTNGASNGIVPMLRVFNNTAKYVDQGGGKRNGSFAIYLEPWHADVELFLQMRKNHGDEELKARDLFYALWMPDLFMERIKADGQWTLMCPDECPGLADVYGDAFKELYTSYETAGRGRKTVKARDLWFQIMDAQMETGTPYLVYKDAANKKSNQQNVGTIKSSNLCVAPETPILTDKGHVEIQSVEGKCVNVWNGEQFSEVTVRKTGENQELIEVYTTDGCKLSCTKYHKFYTINGETIEAKDLSVGDELLTCEFPVIDGPDDFPDAYNEGFWTEANYTPFPTTANMKSKMDWLSGICDNYGNVSSQNQLTLELNTHHRAHNVKLILQTCGIQISFRSSSITLSSNQLQKMFVLGFSPRTTKIFQAQLPTTGLDEPVSVRVTKIVMEGRRSDTYCFTEPLRHAGVFGGLLTSQCSEILEYSDKDETAVCNLASLALPAFVNTETSPPTFDYEKLHRVSRVVTYNLNRVIDVNYYPTEKTRRSNMRHRPIGIGVQGLADVFMLMGLPFTSEGARTINRDIFETIYHAAVTESCEMAKAEGAYETFRGSPADVGKLQFDLWGVTPSDRYDWTALKQSVKEYGMRNSLLMAPMPTASTSQILGYNECIEPITSNIYSRRTIAGEFIMANKYLMKDLMDVGMWNERVKNSIVANHGSIQHLGDLPELIREKYRTVWEIPMRGIIDMAADRGAYICQSQSLNLWLEDPNYSLLTSMHFYAWSKGLKTGIYYLRRRARHQAQQFTIEPDKKPAEESEEICEMCSA
jgi:ribonucleotide reductase alpha subunit